MRIESTLEEVAAMEQANDAQEKGYALGVSTLVELLEAHKRLHRTHAFLSKARFELAKSLSDLRIYSGNFGGADLSEWDSWFHARNYRESRSQEGVGIFLTLRQKVGKMRMIRSMIGLSARVISPRTK